MNKKNNILVLFIMLFSSLLGGGGQFTGWGDTILHHVADSNIVHVYGIPISKHVIMILISAITTLVLALLATKKYRKDVNAKPRGLSQIFEILMDFINKEIVIPHIGAKDSKTWTPVAITFFVFILVCNLLGLIPFFEFIKWGGGGGSTPTGNFSVTVALAIITFFMIIIAGIKKHGFIGHWKNMVPSDVPKPVLIILIPIEIIGMIVKPIALTLRLGANMTAGHIGMVAIFGLPFLLDSFGIGIVSISLNTAIFFLEIIVCLVQAYVFSLLSAVFIGMAIHAEH